MPAQKGIKVIAKNRSAFHNYFIEERFEAGIELCGTEVKSIRAGQSQPEGLLLPGEERRAVRVMRCTSPPMRKVTCSTESRDAIARLLMHKREIMRLYGRIKQDGYALIPLSLYFKDSKVKVEIGLAKGKKLYDKREAAAERSAKREMDRTMKSYGRG